MSECPAEEVLSRFLERVASSDEVATVSTHLESCVSCRRLVAVLADDVTSADPEGHEGFTPRGEGELVGPYRLSRRLGSGAMGDVFLAVDTRLGREVAIKQLRSRGLMPGTEQRLLDEARGLARLNHPNIVSIFDVVLSEGHVWLAMEYVEGTTLREWLTGARSVAEIAAVFEQVCQGLAAAHERGVVHRDVKPANVLVGRDGRVRVSDFGMAMVDGVMVAEGGTPAYMSPEQQQGQATAASSDQYSLSVAFAEALTGHRPSVNERIEWPASVPTRLRATIERGLRVEPSERFGSMHEYRASLHGAGASRGWRWAAGLALIAGLGLAATWAAQRRPEVSLPTLLEQTAPSVVTVVVSLPDEEPRVVAGVLVPRGDEALVLTVADALTDAVHIDVLRWQRGWRTYAQNEGAKARFLFEHQRDFIGARRVSVDIDANLAVLKLDERIEGEVAPFVASTSAAAGDDVVSVGHPNDELWAFRRATLTSVHETSLQVNGEFERGLWGGPLVDRQGRIIGLVTSAHTAASAAAALHLFEGSQETFVADRSTPEQTLMTCLRAFELGQADAWLSCLDEDEEVRRHNEVLDWMFAHATLSEAQSIRILLSNQGDFYSREHVREEVIAKVRQSFSHASPAAKARGALLANLGGSSLDFPEETIRMLHQGWRIEEVNERTERLAWVLVTAKDATGHPVQASYAVVRGDDGWCIRQVPFPEEAARLPEGYPRVVEWHELIEAEASATLASWRQQLQAMRTRWW